jgi:hypothetical protein
MREQGERRTGSSVIHRFPTWALALAAIALRRSETQWSVDDFDFSGREKEQNDAPIRDVPPQSVVHRPRYLTCAPSVAATRNPF